MIKANITRENTTLIVSDDITHLSQETDRNGLIKGFTESEHGDNPGLFHQPRIKDLHDAESRAENNS